MTITQGKIGYVFARDGKPLEPAQVLASNVDTKDFQDVEAFLKAGGQRGPQRLILREGTYAITLLQFIVITEGRVYSLPLNREEAEHGIRATAICPAFVATKMTEWTGLPAEEQIQPEDIAELVRTILRLSPKARVPQVVIERVGDVV